jgi:hypothetical protein
MSKEFKEAVKTIYPYHYFLLDDFKRKQLLKMYEAGQNHAHEEVNDLKRKLFNEGVKNNSNVARVEFLEDKLEDAQAVIDAAREVGAAAGLVMAQEFGSGDMLIALPRLTASCHKFRALDSEGRNTE